MYIEHHGVKGQKWGVRKRSSASPSGDAKAVAKLKAKPVASLTNKQLKTANERLNLEQNYRRMNPSAVSRGRQTAQALLATAGIGVALYNLVKSPAGKATVSIGKKAAVRALNKKSGSAADAFGSLNIVPRNISFT